MVHPSGSCQLLSQVIPVNPHTVSNTNQMQYIIHMTYVLHMTTCDGGGCLRWAFNLLTFAMQPTSDFGDTIGYEGWFLAFAFNSENWAEC